MKTFLAVLAILFVSHSVHSSKKYRCKDIDDCDGNVENYFLGSNENFRGTVFSELNSEVYNADEFNLFNEDTKTTFVANDGTVTVSFSNSFREETAKIEDEIYELTQKYRGPNGNSQTENSNSKYSEFRDVIEVTKEYTQGKNPFFNKNQRMNPKQIRNRICTKECLETLNVVYDIHLAVTWKLLTLYRDIFVRYRNDRGMCNKQKMKYRSLYRKEVRKFPNPIARALTKYTNDRIYKTFCKKGYMY